MKNRIIYISMIFILIMGIQYVIGQNSLFGSDYEFNVTEAFSNETPSQDYAGNLFRSNEWGGGDAPDPEEGDNPTGGTAPIGDGIFILICAAAFFLFIKIRKINMIVLKEK